MGKAGITWAMLLASLLMMGHLRAQKTAEVEQAPPPLVLTGSIPLPNVQGRIDHMSIDPNGRLFISALGNNTEEILDLTAGTRLRSISGIPRPQGVVYCADVNKLFVGSDEGKLYVYDARTFELITSIDYGDDVDNLRYDAAKKQVYVGYGSGESGAIGIVDAGTNRRLPKEFKVGAHPESFQLESQGPNIYVNVPDRKQIVIINRDTGGISRWPIAFDSNFPMALDEGGHRLFVATRTPARLLIFDTSSGQMISALPCVEGSDDLFYDATRERIYVTGGEGYVSVFQQEGNEKYRLAAKIPSGLGARTSGYFGKGRKGFDLFYVAVPARANAAAEVLIYTVQK
jgi:DNA-binding beta-propeller fold protein YncE